MTQPPTGPKRRKPQTPLTDAQVAQVINANRTVSVSGLAILAALIAQSAPLPWGLSALVFAVVGVIFGVIGLIRVLKARALGLSVYMSILSLFMGGAILVTSTVMAISYPTMHSMQTCMDEAITSQAKAECTQKFDTEFQDLINSYSPGQKLTGH